MLTNPSTMRRFPVAAVHALRPDWFEQLIPPQAQPQVTTPPTDVVPATPVPAPAPQIDQLASAKAAAKARAMSLVAQRGLDPTQFASLIDSEIERLSGTLAPGSDPSKAFGDTSIANNVLQGEEARLRNQYMQQADQRFGQNYGEKQVASTLLDDTINSILKEQEGNASTYLERGKARGIYNDVGYNAGRAALDTASSTARSKLFSMGHDVINRYRSDANAVRDKAYGAASGYTLGRSPIDLDAYAREGEDIARRAREFGGGDLRSMLGGTNFFDFSSLNNRAGMAQGALNLRDTDVATALAERRRLQSQRRGLGSQGAF